jgi:ribose transport system ATP-binding protein
MAEPLLLMTGIQKAFAGVPALRDASLRIMPGEVHALVGQNGAGKSTLIKILTGVYSRDAGEVRWDGRAVDLRSPREAQGVGIGTIYQELTLVPQRTVTENIVLGYEPRTRLGAIDWRARATRGARGALPLRDSSSTSTARWAPTPPPSSSSWPSAARHSLDARLLIMDEPTLLARTSGRWRRCSGSSAPCATAAPPSSTSATSSTSCSWSATASPSCADGRTVGETRIADTTKLDPDRRDAGARRPRRSARPGARSFRGQTRTGEVFLEARGLPLGPAAPELDLEVRAGEIVGLAGLLGSGARKPRARSSGSIASPGARFA